MKRLPGVPELVRLAGTVRRTGLLGEVVRRPTAALETILRRRGLDARNVHGLVAALHPERIALVDSRRSLSYAEVDAEIDALAVGMRDHLGASVHRPILLLMENRVEYVLTWFAALRSGIRCAHASPHATPDEIEELVTRTKASVVVASGETYDVAREVVRRRPGLDLRLLRTASGDLGLHYDDVVDRGLRSRTRVLAKRGGPNIVFTSGTTGKPKAAVRDVAGVGPVELLRLLERLPLRVGDRHLVVSPLYHSAAQAFVLICSALGCSIELMERYEPEALLCTLSARGIHSVFLVPTMIRGLVELPDELYQAHPPSELRALVSGAAVFDPVLRRRAVERFGPAVVFDFYGATELGWVTLVDGHEMLEKPGSLGRPIGGQEVAIFDDEGRRLGPGHIGTVYTRSRQVIEGYADDDAANRAMRRGSWSTVDDLGYLDHDGALFLTGRSRDMVISGGVNLYPSEIEHVLAEHPSVREVSVIGVPDEHWGESLVAVVVPGRDFDADVLQAWARSRLAGYKVPRRYECVEVLPRNPTGKVLKRALMDRFGSAMRDGAS